MSLPFLGVSSLNLAAPSGAAFLFLERANVGLFGGVAQPAGRKRLSALEWERGRGVGIGDRFGD